MFRFQVMWHPDIIHAVEDQDSAQLHPANVVYTAALPMCPLNARYVSPLNDVTKICHRVAPPLSRSSSAVLFSLFLLALQSHIFLSLPLSATLFDNGLHSLAVSNLPTFVRALQKKRAVSLMLLLMFSNEKC
jgi:hypothetical protein